MTVRVAFFISLASLCFLQVCFAQQTTRALQSYVTKKDSAYNWKVDNVVPTDEGSFYEVSLLSQKWQGINWTHRLIVYFPKKAKYSNTLLIVLRHLYDRPAGLAGLKYISDSAGTASAFLYDMPNQPLFDGKEEDDLQAFTFSQYLRTGGKSWPLLFPMVKSVVRALDAIQDISSRREKHIVDKFIVAGHSKRGHASWLTAAVDSRVKGIIPIAIDVLNAKAQMPYHLDAFGAYSTPTKEATDFLSKLNNPLGNSLIELIDPYAYKENLTAPKLIVCATNDEYFPTDALNLYWDGLRGNKSILYLSNTGHVRADSDPRINPTAFAFARAVAEDKTLPQFSWECKLVKDSIQLIISADTAAVQAVLW
jgi:PhoPQ-activated pathogenicity-related protein